MYIYTIIQRTNLNDLQGISHGLVLGTPAFTAEGLGSVPGLGTDNGKPHFMAQPNKEIK